MHLRSSSARGIPVVDDTSQQVVGFLDTPLIEPDTGRILGFFVQGVFSAGHLFLQAADIAAWGTRIHVRDEDRLCPPEELVRLRPAFEEPRTLLGQYIRTRDTKRTIGICADVQFNTRHFMVEWLFPRRFFFARQPLPVTDVLEVTPDAVWVKDPFRPAKEKTQEKPTAVPAEPVREVLPALSRRAK